MIPRTILGVICLFALISSSVQADNENFIQMKSGTLVSPKMADSEPYLEPLERLLPTEIRRAAKRFPDLDKFLRKNAHKHCAYRKIKFATSWFFDGTFIQVFENKKTADDFSKIGQKVKEPWWAPGVIGIIGFTLFEGEILEAEEFVSIDSDKKVSSKNLLANRNNLSPIVINVPELYRHILSPDMNKPRLKIRWH